MASALGSQDGRSCLHPNHLHCIPLIVDGDDAAGAATARPQFASPAPKNAKAEVSRLRGQYWKMNVSDAELSSLGAVGGESPRETCLRSFG